jgi:hypothetical protein
LRPRTAAWPTHAGPKRLAWARQDGCGDPRCRSCNATCGWALACASIALIACCRIVLRVSRAVS